MHYIALKKRWAVVICEFLPLRNTPVDLSQRSCPRCAAVFSKNFSIDLSEICVSKKENVSFFHSHGVLGAYFARMKQKKWNTADRIPLVKQHSGRQSRGQLVRGFYRRKGSAFLSTLKLRISEMASPSSVRAVPPAAIRVMRSCNTTTAVITVTTGTR